MWRSKISTRAANGPRVGDTLGGMDLGWFVKTSVAKNLGVFNDQADSFLIPGDEGILMIKKVWLSR